MSGLGTCKKCGDVVHWYQLSSGRTHPPLDRIPGTTLTVDRQDVYERPAYVMHRCGIWARDAWEGQKQWMKAPAPPLSALARQHKVMRVWYVQTLIDHAELTGPCPECYAEVGSPCENYDYRLGHIEEPRFEAEPHQMRMDAVDVLIETAWASALSFRYVSLSDGEEHLFSYDPDGTLRPKR